VKITAEIPLLQKENCPVDQFIKLAKQEQL